MRMRNCYYSGPAAKDKGKGFAVHMESPVQTAVVRRSVVVVIVVVVVVAAAAVSAAATAVAGADGTICAIPATP